MNTYYFDSEWEIIAPERPRYRIETRLPLPEIRKDGASEVPRQQHPFDLFFFEACDLYIGSLSKITRKIQCGSLLSRPTGKLAVRRLRSAFTMNSGDLVGTR